MTIDIPVPAPIEWRVMLDRDPWQEHAACRGMDPEIFYPVVGPGAGNGAYERAYHRAREVCAGCPVAAECLAGALARKERYGMFGGLNPSQRNMTKRRLTARPPRCCLDCGKPMADRQRVYCDDLCKATADRKHRARERA